MDRRLRRHRQDRVVAQQGDERRDVGLLPRVDVAAQQLPLARTGRRDRPDAELALELAIRRGTARTAFGKRLVDLGGNRERIADARIAIDQARLLVVNAAWKLDVGGPMNALSEVSQIKVVVPNMAQAVIDFAIQVHGGAGYVDDHPVERYFRDVRVTTLYEGTSQIQKLIIGRAATGINALVPA